MSALSAVRKVLLGPPRHALRWFRGAPRWLQAALVLLALGAAGVGGYYVFHTRAAGAKQRAVLDGWKRFDEAVRGGDEAGMRAALDEVIAADPADPLARKRLDAVATLDADPSDPPMVVLTLRMSLRAKRPADALREADKRLKHDPGDWLAHCVRASDFVTRGDREAAARELDALSPINHPDLRLDIGTLLYALRLHRATGRDLAPLRSFLQARVLPMLRANTAQTMPAPDKLGLIECYLEAFEPDPSKPQPHAVAQGWAAAAELADLAFEEANEEKDAATLARIGRTGAPLHAALQALRRNEHVTEAQCADLRRELEDRTRRSWERVQELDPANHESYHGLALVKLRAQDYLGAREQVARGLVAAGDGPELAQLFSRMLQLEGRPLEAYQALAHKAEQTPGTVVWWGLAAEAAIVGRRRDLALEACRRMRQVDPDNGWAVRTESRLWLEAGDARKTLEVLAPVGEVALSANPEAARVYARALAEAGQAARAEAFLELAEGNEAAAAAALRGWAEATTEGTERSAKAADRAAVLLSRWPDNPDLLRVQAQALLRVAEWSSPAWEPVRVARAVQAHERLRARLPDDRAATVGLGWLRLYGQDNPDHALRDLAPLRAAESAPGLAAAELELLGIAYRRTGQLDQAVQTLLRAAKLPDVTAGCFTQLALAYHARGQKGEARAALEAARTLPQSPREQVDYLAAAKLIVQ